MELKGLRVIWGGAAGWRPGPQVCSRQGHEGSELSALLPRQLDTLLCRNAKQDRVQVAEALMEANADPNMRDS
eukprot:2666096-Rhodomonas_salina.3